jgi:phosphopantothenate---cysteine ligase (CTP)
VRCLVTAGPTFESLDQVRRLTNFSTGRLGSELANFLAAKGHETALLLGQQATWHGQHQAQVVGPFSTTDDLAQRLRELSEQPWDAVFHAAAVSDFRFGKIWRRSASGALTELTEGKISSRQGAVLAELVPTEKLICNLRDWFGRACLVGWKYEVEGDRAAALAAGSRQIKESRTQACVLNGPAYGGGFGLLDSNGHCEHCPAPADLFSALERLANRGYST